MVNKKIFARIFLITLLTMTFGHAVKATQKDNQEKKQKHSLWARFYHFRKDYVYPVNHYVSLFSLGTLNGLEMAQHKAGYDTLPGGIWCTRWWVGIVDAAAANQPAEVIVKDDVIRRLGYIALYLGMQASVKKFSNGAASRVRAVVPDYAVSYVSNAGFNNIENTIVFRFLGHLILDKAARVIGKIVVDPFAHAAYYTVKYKKKDWWGKKPAAPAKPAPKIA
jgi:hypothetical protein